jgi:hypothetical protein
MCAATTRWRVGGAVAVLLGALAVAAASASADVLVTRDAMAGS